MSLHPLNFADAIRFLSIDSIEKSSSGHPGAPMGMADIADVLWRDFLKHNPKNPKWVNRDRFVLSNGHASMLLYSLLHLTGYDVSIEDLKSFRQMSSKTPGHPENFVTSGIETTTGPLGQGLANAVGMAIGEVMLGAQFNRTDFPIIDHFTYAFVGDGCLMEGVSHEVSSLAGHLGLGKLIVFWDDNGISIDGKTEGWFTENVAQRYLSYGWHVIPCVDGHDKEALNLAIQSAQLALDKPTLICCRTHIGFGSPNKQDSAASHGSPLGCDEAALVRKTLNWPYAPFEIPDTIYDAYNAVEAGQALEAQWQLIMNDYETIYPTEFADLMRRLSGELPDSFDSYMLTLFADFQAKSLSVASRKASFLILEKLVSFLPELVGGSADLSPSNLTFTALSKTFQSDQTDGNYIEYGVREFGMVAIMNGLNLYGGFRPYGATFLMFMEYAKNAIRMGALMRLNNIYVFTHDSIGLGEDGPTHQPVEQMSALRLVPNLLTYRPFDVLETCVAWFLALKEADFSHALVLSRQTLPALENDCRSMALISKGGYILKDCDGIPDLIIMATGSEVSLALSVADSFDSIKIRVVSMFCVELFKQQSLDYQYSVLPKNVLARVAIEAGIPDLWYQFVGLDGLVIGMNSFGLSAPGDYLFEHFGFSTDTIVTEIKKSFNF